MQPTQKEITNASPEQLTEEELFDTESYHDFSALVIIVPLVPPVLFLLFILLRSFF